ncbi:hypothetical protein [Curtobacterium oceanosedimentum]|uniref:hypothetical protein n=1 Tax=Curtobacterium oceanosedimentum TaxID=465820 RepID=UPI001CE1F29C|nr:hypothetical protein [Curtobacterium oceanosedimentum]MCA5923057.1 hypothetical protein [Curtobacterium oceanosedimentum]
MSPFRARCLVVGAACALALTGLLAPLSGGQRWVLFVAAACCALVDVLLHRSVGEAATGPTPPVATPPVTTPPVLTPPAAALATDEQRAHDDGAPVLVLGRRPDGTAVEVPERSHVVVVGRGALAAAVFRGIVEQLRLAVGDAGAAGAAELRTAAAPGLLRDAAEGPMRPLPPDTAAAVRVQDDGRPRGTVVLVPGLGAVPRRWDVTVEVTRYGCSVRRHGDQHATTVSPALPKLPVLHRDPDAPGTPTA